MRVAQCTSAALCLTTLALTLAALLTVPETAQQKTTPTTSQNEDDDANAQLPRSFWSIPIQTRRSIANRQSIMSVSRDTRPALSSLGNLGAERGA